MNQAQQVLIEEVRAWFGDRAVITDQSELEPWLSEWRKRWHGTSYGFRMDACGFYLF